MTEPIVFLRMRDDYGDEITLTDNTESGRLWLFCREPYNSARERASTTPVLDRDMTDRLIGALTEARRRLWPDP